MIPYFPEPQIRLGPVVLHGFGLLIVLGVWFGYTAMIARAVSLEIPQRTVRQLAHWAVIPGFIVSHVFEAVFYRWTQVEDEGVVFLFRIWDGISSYGGFLGALLGLLAFYYLTAWKQAPVHDPRNNLLVYSDLLIHGLVVGWVLGRLGCTIKMDHPGELSHFWLAFERPGGSRHNMGFYEFLYTLFVLLPASRFLSRGTYRPGLELAVISLLYAPVRFVLDFYRSAEAAGGDTRHGGLTPAQYCSVGLALFSCWLLVRVLRREPITLGAARGMVKSSGSL